MKIDPSLLSALSDGEISSPWKEKLEALAASDSTSSHILAENERVKKLLHSLPEPDWSISQEKVYQELQKKLSGRPRVLPLTKRKLSLSFPLVAAASFLVAFGSLMSGMVLANFSHNSQNQQARIAVETLRNLSREDVLALMSQDSITEVQMTLPSTVNLKLRGEGQLMHVTNYAGAKE